MSSPVPHSTPYLPPLFAHYGNDGALVLSEHMDGSFHRATLTPFDPDYAATTIMLSDGWTQRRYRIVRPQT